MILILITIGNTTFAGGRGAVDTSKSPHVKLRSLPMADVKWTDGFWADRFELCHKSMLSRLHSTMLDPKCSAQLNRIKFTAGLYEKNPGGVNWADGDCYKWIETMAHVYSVMADPELDRLMDQWIAVIAKAHRMVLSSIFSQKRYTPR